VRRVKPTRTIRFIAFYRSSLSRPAEPGTDWFTRTKGPVNTQARWRAAKRGASIPPVNSSCSANAPNFWASTCLIIPLAKSS
jgi:hypothetical protein